MLIVDLVEVFGWKEGQGFQVFLGLLNIEFCYYDKRIMVFCLYQVLERGIYMYCLLG